jgi:tetratricopeptide (TPR) repeat protein
MKKIAFAILTLAMVLTGTEVFAQGKYGADSANCIIYLSYYKEYFKQKNYDEALPNWRKAYEICPPTANQTMLVDGTTLIRRLIAKNANNPEYKKALVDTLMALHDARIEFYPKYAATALNNKGLDMSNYIKNDPKTLYEGYNTIIEANGTATKASILLFDLNAAIDLYQKGELSAEEVINTYQRNLDIVKSMTAKTEIEAEQNDKVKADLEGLFITSKVASCENLIALFTPRFEANPDDVAVVSNIVSMLNNTEGCTDNELFLKAVTAMHKIEPSYKSAYFLYRLNSSRGNVNEAISYLEQAIAYPESDSMTDGDYYNELAKFCYKNNMKGKAFDAAVKAAELNPSVKGECYMLIGNIWAATSCGGDEISRRAPYWVAVDYYQRAAAADESLRSECSERIAACSRYFPQTAEAFMYDLQAGQSYTVSCGGMRATTTVRTQK